LPLERTSGSVTSALDKVSTVARDASKGTAGQPAGNAAGFSGSGGGGPVQAACEQSRTIVAAMAAQMIKTLKGKVLGDLSAIHKEALERAPKRVEAPDTGGAPVDKEGNRFTNRLAQDRMEGGFGFVMTANSVGDNHFAREQTAAFKRADDHKRQMENDALTDFEANKARAATEALEKEQLADAKAAKSFAWGAASLKPKRPLAAAAAADSESSSSSSSTADDTAKRRKKEPAQEEQGGAAAAAAAADTDAASTASKDESGSGGGSLAGLGIGDYGSSSDSDSDSDD
jgi:hypothetical protein